MIASLYVHQTIVMEVIFHLWWRLLSQKQVAHRQLVERSLKWLERGLKLCTVCWAPKRRNTTNRKPLILWIRNTVNNMEQNMELSYFVAVPLSSLLHFRPNQLFNLCLASPNECGKSDHDCFFLQWFQPLTKPRFFEGEIGRGEYGSNCHETWPLLLHLRSPHQKLSKQVTLQRCDCMTKA